MRDILVHAAAYLNIIIVLMGLVLGSSFLVAIGTVSLILLLAGEFTGGHDDGGEDH
jgi:hypothetical protein